MAGGVERCDCGRHPAPLDERDAGLELELALGEHLALDERDDAIDHRARSGSRIRPERRQDGREDGAKNRDFAGH